MGENDKKLNKVSSKFGKKSINCLQNVKNI